jgi:hypothetical protein
MIIRGSDAVVNTLPFVRKPNYAGQNFNPIRLNYSGWGNNLESLVMVE